MLGRVRPKATVCYEVLRYRINTEDVEYSMSSVDMRRNVRIDKPSSNVNMILPNLVIRGTDDAYKIIMGI